MPLQTWISSFEQIGTNTIYLHPPLTVTIDYCFGLGTFQSHFEINSQQFLEMLKHYYLFSVTLALKHLTMCLTSNATKVQTTCECLGNVWGKSSTLPLSHCTPTFQSVSVHVMQVHGLSNTWRLQNTSNQPNW